MCAHVTSVRWARVLGYALRSRRALGDHQHRQGLGPAAGWRYSTCLPNRSRLGGGSAAPIHDAAAAIGYRDEPTCRTGYIPRR
jgi:hypothetical protein